MVPLVHVYFNSIFSNLIHFTLSRTKERERERDAILRGESSRNWCQWEGGVLGQRSVAEDVRRGLS